MLAERHDGGRKITLAPAFDGERPDSIVVAHDDTGTGVYEDAEANWFNVESKDMLEIGDHLKALGSKLR